MDINFNINEDHNKLLSDQLKKKHKIVSKGGGDARVAKLHAAGKMTARERVDFLFDSPEKALEIINKNKSTNTVAETIKNKIENGEAVSTDDFDDVFENNVSPN